jgi:hypothetical protein
MEDNHKKHYQYTPVVLAHSAQDSIHTEMDYYSRYSGWRKILPYHLACRQKEMHYHHTENQLSIPSAHLISAQLHGGQASEEE